MNDRPTFRRPAMLSPEQADMIPGDSDPTQRSEAAHTTAEAIVHRARAASDPELVQRLVKLVEIEGLDAVAGLWSDSPADTLPGALWRLYQLREWVGNEPETIAQRYQDGLQHAEVAGVVAGVATPPGPSEVGDLADNVLSGVFSGDLAVALERASAFCRVLATGVALDADTTDQRLKTADAGKHLTQRAGALMTIAEEFEHAASLWRAEKLD